MKTIEKLLAVAAVVTVSATLSAKAGEPLYSPKAKEQADSHRTVAVSSNDANLALNRPVGNAKAWEVTQSLNKIGGTSSIDLAHAARPALGAKDTGYEAAWRENALGGVQIAPAK